MADPNGKPDFTWVQRSGPDPCIPDPTRISANGNWPSIANKASMPLCSSREIGGRP
jgi:hypothetical protein